MRTVDLARGHWRDVLAELGVEDRYLANKHGPCPLCGGRDRYRFDDRNGTGSYFCNQCGPGSGIGLVMKLHGLCYPDACRQVDAVLGSGVVPRVVASRIGDPEARRRDLQRVLDEATAPDIVAHYLQSRGLIVVPPVLLGHRSLIYNDDGRRERHPAMLAPVIDLERQLQSVHRTYLADVRGRKKLMTPVDTVIGSAVRLFDVADAIGLAEGVETAIAAHEIFGVPTWAAISASGLEKVVLPPGVKKVLIFADNDENFVGQKAAFALANRLASLDVEVHIPPQTGTDWLDVLNERRPAWRQAGS